MRRIYSEDQTRMKLYVSQDVRINLGLTHLQVFAEESLTDQQLVVCLPGRSLLLPLGLLSRLLQLRIQLPLLPP